MAIHLAREVPEDAKSPCTPREAWAFAIVTILLVIAKQLMTHGLPCSVLGEAAHDDRLMVTMAESLSAGEWLGPYNALTLVKGVGYPLFLCVVNATGIGYIDAIELFYSVSCVIFVLSVRHHLPRAWHRILMLAVLLFAPISTSVSVAQRVYRCALTPGCALLFFGPLFRLGYLAREGKGVIRMLPWALTCGFALVWLWHTREDGIWLIPATGVALLFAFVSCVRSSSSLVGKVFKVAFLCVPVVMLVTSTVLISRQNEVAYGQDLPLELSGGNFPQAIRALYSIAPEEGEVEYGPRVTVSDQILRRALRVSPTLASIEPQLWECWPHWTKAGGEPEGQVKNGWFFWCLRAAVESSGHYSSAEDSEAFYGAVASEIRAAIERGELAERWTMPSALMPPYKSGYLVPLMQSAFDCLKLVVTSGRTNSSLCTSDLTMEETIDSAAFVHADVIPTEEAASDSNRLSVSLSNNVYRAYLFVSPALGILGVLGFVLMLVQVLRGAMDAVWCRGILLDVGIALLALGVLVAGLAYTEVFSFDTVLWPMYVSGVYPLYLLMSALGAIYVMDVLVSAVRG